MKNIKLAYIVLIFSCIYNFTYIDCIETSSKDQFEFDKTVISIANIVKEFDKFTSCQAQFWKNNPENSCKCCLVKYSPELDRNKQPEDVVKMCLETKRCDEAVIQQMLKEQNINSKDKNKNLLDLITTIYDKSVVIKNVAANDIKDIQFKPDGSFTSKSLVDFLSKAYQRRKLLNPDFKAASCLKATDIMGEKGFATKQLFLISSTCSGEKKDYILKEGTGGMGEVIKLEKALLLPVLAPYIYPHEVENFPAFILPEAYIAYKHGHQAHDLSLMTKAPGIILSNFIKLYKNRSITQDEIKKAFYETGLAISNFHKRFMHNFKSEAVPGKLLNPTYTHGDAHQSNIFYDKATNKVIFIDNERIEHAPNNPFIDIQYILLMTLTLLITADIKKDTAFLNNWLTLTTEAFLNGYIDAYDKGQRKKLFDEIVYKFNHQEEYHTPPPHNLYDVYRNYKQPFDTAFEALKKKYS